MHAEAVHLAIALNLNRVLLRDPFGKGISEYNYKVPFCLNQTNPAAHYTLECYYHPWSSCGIKDIFSSFYEASNKSMLDIESMPVLHHWRDVLSTPMGNLSESIILAHAKFIRLPQGVYNIRGLQFLPNQFECIYGMYQQTLPSINKLPSNRWWSSIATAFLLRPNSITLNKLSELKNPSSITNLDALVKNSSVDLSDMCPYEASQCLGIYVRHGDKYTEMKLVDFKRYTEAADHIFKIGALNRFREQCPINPPHRTIFFGTETPHILKSAIEWSNSTSTTLYYTNLFDRSTVSASEMTDRGIYHNMEYLSMILNLDMTLQCRAWIGTLKSNWCEIVDEMRMTVARKADLLYVDLK